MKRFTLLRLAALAVTACLSGPAAAQEFRMLSSWDQRYPGVRFMADVFIADVAKATNNKVTIRRSGPEVVPVMQQLQPTTAGAFQMLFTHGGYHAGITGIALALDAVAGDPEKRRQSGLWDFVDAHYAKHNLKLIAMPLAGSSGYHFFLRKPVGTDSFKGLKIRGTPLYHRIINTLGGSPVVLAPTDIYSAMEKGVVDGAGWSLIGGLDYKWYEVAKYIARPTFGVSTHLIMMNRDTWTKLDASTQKVLLDMGRKIENESIATFDRLIAEEVTELKKRGVQEVMLKASRDDIEKLWSDGVWQVAITGPAKDDAEQMRKLAIEKGLSR